ncbi:protein-glutamine gamma-glutamyltransferase [Oscillospiraceae bacterium PP1C4]
MILIGNVPAQADTLSNEYPAGSVERDIIGILSASTEKYQYNSLDQLKFELTLRREIINAANELYMSRLSFKIFRDSMCNPAYWDRMGDGGFSLKNGVKPSDAIRDIYTHSELYGTECATAMMIVYYRALLNTFPEDRFNELFPQIYLMNWHRIDRLLKDVGLMKKAKDYLPGDRRYFANPDVNPLYPEWQGENAIDLGHDLYYGHGVGRLDAETIISALNANRTEGADQSAYLMDSAGRPDFKNLFALYSNTH